MGRGPFRWGGGLIDADEAGDNLGEHGRYEEDASDVRFDATMKTQLALGVGVMLALVAAAARGARGGGELRGPLGRPVGGEPRAGDRALGRG